LLFGTASCIYAQAGPTAGKAADVQIGATFSYVKSDYRPEAWHAYGFYADVDFRYHYGVEFAYHQASSSDPVLYERTYELGGRYIYPVHDRFRPYAKAMLGRGVFNFEGNNITPPVQVANLAYNTQSIGGGLDLRVLPGLNVRVLDYEYQFWSGFPPHGLNPSLISFGVAYHFHGPMGN
jgi:Outer membrane protein beta-barrel domain